MIQIKCIFFDLDGVLCDTKELHFWALNEALLKLDKKYCISKEEEEIYNGLPTREKLKILSQNRGLPIDSHERIYKKKQEITESLIPYYVKPDDEIINLFQSFRKQGYKLAVCTNCIGKTTELFLAALKLDKLVDLVLHNQSISKCKPDPEIYVKAAEYFGVETQETVVVEDSPRGIESAINANCSVFVVKKPSDVYRIEEINNKYAIENFILEIEYEVVK